LFLPCPLSQMMLPVNIISSFTQWYNCFGHLCLVSGYNLQSWRAGAAPAFPDRHSYIWGLVPFARNGVIAMWSSTDDQHVYCQAPSYKCFGCVGNKREAYYSSNNGYLVYWGRH
jgi:hypothetical protein